MFRMNRQYSKYPLAHYLNLGFQPMTMTTRRLVICLLFTNRLVVIVNAGNIALLEYILGDEVKCKAQSEEQ